MSTAIHAEDGRAPRRPVGERRLGTTARGPSATERLALARVFCETARCYLWRVLPQVGSELEQWRGRAGEIPNPRLRDTAAQALGKRGNIEGAALFAILAPAAHRRATVRALVAYQTAYNYLDALSELPSADPLANGDQLHQALLVALYRRAPHPDYYAHNPERGDGGFLTAVVDACRDALAGLPSYAVLAPTARAAAARIVDFQALNLSESQGGHGALRRWASEATPAGSGLAWWETAAGSGSSLAVHALIAAAASPNLDRARADAIERAYWPWTGALHTLLDSLVDRREDHQGGRRCLLDYYHSQTEAATRLALLAARALGAGERLADRHAHRVILTAMCSYYLSAPECDTAEARAIAGALTSALGLPLRVAITLFRARRLAARLAGNGYA
jgi:tetraprenyl-beta-curcumene synthase